jgi:hypothetical protein
MEGVGLILLGVILVAGVATLLWRYRRQRLPAVARSVLCPVHDSRADVTVRTDLDARPCRRYVDVVACSLLSDAAVGLPERRGYLPDSPPCEVLLEPARAYPVRTTDVSCSQPCVFVLNAASSSVTPRPLACASGVSDGIDLMRQVDRRVSGSRLLWYSSF